MKRGVTYGEALLAVNPVLERAAQAKADDMAAKSYFSHNSPDGVTPWFWLNQAGYVFTYAGENLAANFSDSIDVEKLGWILQLTKQTY